MYFLLHAFRYDKGEGAQRHYKSKAHFFNTKNKYRCYFCNAYVQDTKGHLESRHRDMTFQCQLNGCNHPRFTQVFYRWPFSQKVLMHLSFPQTHEPFIFLNLKFWIFGSFKAVLASQLWPSSPYKPLSCQIWRHPQFLSKFQSSKFKHSSSGK